MSKCKIEYHLEYRSMQDDAAKVFVAYIPLLRLSTQARDESRLKEAIHCMVESFVQLCHERGMLEDVMRERGMARIENPAQIAEVKSKGGQYIRVANVARDAYSDVPLALLAGKKAMAECQH